MINWSLIPEYIALLLILVIMLFFYDKNRIRTFRRTLYWTCLWLSAADIILNIICVHTIENASTIPIWANTLINTFYFWLSVLMCSCVAFYLFRRILEFVYEKHCLQRATIGLSAIMVFYTGICLWNLFSGVLFSFDENGVYHRGIYNRIGYLCMLLEIIMLMICYVRNRKSVSADMTRVFRIAVPVCIAIALLQVFVVRSILLNGTIIATINLIIFLGFQSRPIEQDSLTGVGNRKSFFDEISLRTAGRQHYQIIAVTLPNFSDVSQKLGHKKADTLLYQVAQFPRTVFPDCHTYRISSVEFALLLPRRPDGEHEQLLQTIIGRFEQPWLADDNPWTLSFHAAVMDYSGEAWDAEQVITYLEYTLHLAKEEGRKLIHFNEEVCQRYQRREYLLETMQKAISDQRFQVWYQPVYHHDVHAFASAEALLRLTDYEGNPVSPGEFIPLAEEYGMIDALTWIVIEKVCALLGSGDVPTLEQVSVNISMHQFLQRDLLDRVEQLLHRYHVAPHRLKFEITERVLLDDLDYTRETMERMQRHHLNFYLDDFGTGYANFSSMLNLPFEVIKLDRSILSEHPDNPKAQMLPDVLIPFFHSLGQTVVAEGIETAEQAERMLACGADRLQGFYYARPMQETQLVELFRKQAQTAPAN